MAFHVNYANIDPLKNPEMDIFGQILKGYQIAKEPGRMKRLEEKENLSNKILGSEAKFADPLNAATLQEKLANAFYKSEIMGRGRGGIGGSGGMSSDGLSTQFSGGGKKYAPTNLGKLYNEQAAAIEMFGEDSPQALAYGLAIQKATTDPGTRKAAMNFSNVLQSIEGANVDDLVRYSGPKGFAKLKIEEAKDLSGTPSEEYLRFKEAQKAVGLEVQELRQALGASITPEIDRAFREIVNPSSIKVSPETAKRMILKSRNIIKKQAKTLQNSLKSTGAYQTEEDPFESPESVMERNRRALQESYSNAGQEPPKTGQLSDEVILRMLGGS